MIQYAKEFLILQVRFAQKIAKVSNQALEDVLIDYTMLRNLFNLRVSRDIPNPLWNAFVKGLGTPDNPEDWTYTFYLQRITAASDTSDDRKFFGCFSYVYPWRGTKKLRLHFENRETSEYGALSKARMTRRKSELTEMFRYIQAEHPDVETVRGGSWLYNISAYLRLFPPDYVKTAKPVGYETQFWALWGTILLVATDPSENPPLRNSWNALTNRKQLMPVFNAFHTKCSGPSVPLRSFIIFIRGDNTWFKRLKNKTDTCYSILENRQQTLEKSNLLTALHINKTNFSSANGRDENIWVLPGGRTESGETAKETAHRELLEETGATFKNLEVLCYIHCFMFNTEYWGIAYLGEVKTLGNPTDLNEVSEARLFSYLPENPSKPGPFGNQSKALYHAAMRKLSEAKN